MKQKIRPDGSTYDFATAYYTLQELEKILVQHEFDTVEALANMAAAEQKIDEIIKAIVLA